MKPILHIIKNSDDRLAVESLKNQAGDNAYGVVAVFIQNALPPSSIPNVRTCVLTDKNPTSALYSDIDPHIELIGYDDLLELIFSVESIIVW